MEAVNAVPVVGEPLAYGIGFVMLLFVALTDSWAGSLVTVAHESGHMVLAAATGRGHRGFKIKDDGNAVTEIVDPSFGVGDWFVTFAGYAFPPLLGLGGVVLVQQGQAWSVLWVAIVLLLVAFYFAKNTLANAITLVALAGVVWAALDGTAFVQAAVAVALVWWLLLGGVRDAVRMSLADGTDAYWLARRTLLPRPFWKAVWIFIAIVCLWVGARRLLGL
jgi:hypothetical protein